MSCPYSTAAAQLSSGARADSPQICMSGVDSHNKEKKTKPTNLELRVYPVEMENTNLLGALENVIVRQEWLEDLEFRDCEAIQLKLQ